MYKHVFEHRVRYKDTDQMGVVYYGNYASFYEIGRCEAIRSIGFPYKQLEESGILMPITKMNSRFIRSAYYDDLLRIETVVKELPDRLITFDYFIYNEQNELINEGSTQLIFMDAKTRKPCHAPEVLKEKMRKAFFDFNH